MSFRLISLLIISVCIASTAFADSVIYQDGLDGYAGTDDGTIVGSTAHSNLNFGLNVDLSVGSNDSAAYLRRDLVRFNITSLAGEYDSINSATLRLYAHNTYEILDGAANSLQLFAITPGDAGWVEGTGTTGSAEAGTACWNSQAYDAATPTAWTNGVGAAVTSSALDSVAFTTSAPSGWVEFDIPTTLIESWATGTNAGLLVKMQDEVIDGLMQFYSSDSALIGKDNLRPQLVIDYEEVPEPSTIILLLTMAGAGFLVWRRR